MVYTWSLREAKVFRQEDAAWPDAGRRRAVRRRAGTPRTLISAWTTHEAVGREPWKSAGGERRPRRALDSEEVLRELREALAARGPATPGQRRRWWLESVGPLEGLVSVAVEAGGERLECEVVGVLDCSTGVILVELCVRGGVEDFRYLAGRTLMLSKVLPDAADAGGR